MLMQHTSGFILNIQPPTHGVLNTVALWLSPVVFIRPPNYYKIVLILNYLEVDFHNCWTPVCVCGGGGGEPHRDRGVNILLENGQIPHNSSYEAPCLPWGATREVDDGILVVESWLMSATAYIAIDNTPLCSGVNVDGRSGLANTLCLF